MGRKKDLLEGAASAAAGVVLIVLALEVLGPGRPWWRGSFALSAGWLSLAYGVYRMWSARRSGHS
jgi:hypothetical protein